MFITRQPLKGFQGNHSNSLKSCFVGYILLATFCLNFTHLVKAEPWIDTRDAGLRVDIDRLSNAGIIKVPVNTYPLMWVGIINDLEASPKKALPENLINSYTRTLTAGRKATRFNRTYQSASLSVANESQVLRHFGDQGREEIELTFRRNAINNFSTYNLEITKSVNPWDGEKTRYDNSYFAFVFGNWIGLAGSVEKWWGPSWNSNLILSNNARPTPGLTLQRNYSDSFNFPVLEWLGPWTTSMFMTQLDDERVIDNAKLFGMTVGFRPTPALEINLRRTAQWGGKGRPQSLKSFLKLLSGTGDNCGDLTCKPTEPGNQLGGIDLRWELPWLDTSIYGQTIGEDEAGGLPSRRASQMGMQKSINKPWFEGAVFVEYDETTLKSAPNPYNYLYSHLIYRSGYTYQGRVIGATWDNDSQVTSLGAVGYLSNGDKVEARYSFGDINVDDSGQRHTINLRKKSLKTLVAKWQRDYEWGQLKLEGRYTDQIIDQYDRQKDKLRMKASINYLYD